MQKGFTFIEAMIVIALLGVLASLIIPHLDPNFEQNQIQSKIDYQIAIIKKQEAEQQFKDRARKVYKMTREQGITVEQALRVLDDNLEEKNAKNGSHDVLKVVK